jgi:phosphohistidine swiveling domain-containing protein
MVRVSIDQQLALLSELEAFRVRLGVWPRRSPWDRLDAARALLDRLRPIGTLPFAILARYAFVALALLKSLALRGVVRPEWLDEWLGTLPTVAGDVSARMTDAPGDAARTAALLAWAGHLRPGTYDLTSPTYRDDPSLYLGCAGISEPRERQEHRGALEAELLARKGEVARLACEAGLEPGAQEILAFARAAIPARELSKFEFTRSLSAVLDELCAFGSEVGLSREVLADLPLGDLLDVAVQGPHPVQIEEWKRTAGLNARRMRLTRAICLPDLISSPGQVRSVAITAARPNFVGRGCVTAVPAPLEGGARAELRGKVVLIRSADPGFDWIFAHAPAGLITEHGGVASHMAIRAAEFRLPAAIGCGRLLFDRLARARLIRLDCAGERVDEA